MIRHFNFHAKYVAYLGFLEVTLRQNPHHVGDNDFRSEQGQLEKFKKNFKKLIIKNTFKLKKNFRIFNCPIILKNIQSGPIVFYYVLYNNFFHIQIAPVFVPQKIAVTFKMTLMIFFFFFCSNILISFLSIFSLFCFFLFQKDFDIFRVLLFGVFPCAFDNCYFSFLYKEKNYKSLE